MLRIWMSFFLLISFSNLIAEKVGKSKAPEWVKDIRVLDDKIEEGNGGFQYLLIDIQDNVIEKSIYRHYAVMVTNSEGVQSMSDINIQFDPSYQKLTFHKIQIVRNGQVIDRLLSSEVSVIQRESSMERSLYDGTLSAIVNLPDVRESDVIEYSYSIVGFNPINKGNYSNTYYHQFSSPINRVYNRIIVRKEDDLIYKLYEGADNPQIDYSNGVVEYVWDLNALDYKLYDNNTPIWHDIHRRVLISTFKSWREVVELALPLYTYSNSDLPEIEVAKEESIELRIEKLIRTVQDEVRYLGFESGIGAYQPNKPSKVWNQRYGDCKDKSLLLVALLRREGVEAYPLLVNTQLKERSKFGLPSNGAFDHCVVNFTFENNQYYIDPTYSGQGGSLDEISFPNYGRGLLIRSGQDSLIKLPENKRPSISIKEVITIDEVGKGAEITIRTEYTGSKADYIRGYFNSNSKEYIQKEYLNYYSNLYQNLEIADELKLIDYDRSSSNKLITEEYYHVEKFWLDSEDSSFIYFETNPLVLQTDINYPKSADRTMPYYLGSPYFFSQYTQVILPSDWSIQDFDLTIEGDGFSYHNGVIVDGNVVSVVNDYELLKEYIPEESVSDFLMKHERIKNELSYYLTYDQSLVGFKLSWISISLMVVAFSLGAVIAGRIHKGYNPQPWIYSENTAIGGWLILPAIGLILTPIVLITQIVTDEYLNHNSWLGFLNYDNSKSISLLFFFGGEIIYNVLFLVFSILMIVLFFTRRTSVPKLISVFYIAAFLGPIIDFALAELLMPELLTDSDRTETYSTIARSVVSAVIWIPYFNLSERVKSTFCKQINE